MPSSVREFASSQQRNFAPASVAGWSAYVNAPVSRAALDIPAGKLAASVAGSYANHAVGLQKVASVAGWSARVNSPVAVKKVSVVGWSAYVNAPVVVKEAASVVGWSAYANPPTIVKSEDVQKPQNPKSPESLRRR